ncbi:MAG: hypothetical protein V2B19_11080 [Pseudomonadota bacterium]
MDTSLNKKQLQETLRQMGIGYPPSASKEDLLKSLQRENQNQWIRLADNGGSVHSKRIVRKKSGRIEAVSVEPQQGERIDKHSQRNAPPIPRIEKRVQRRDPIRKTEWLELKPEPDSSGNSSPPVVQSAKELKEYALKRADGICELCDTPINGAEDRLMACFFIDPSEGRNRTAKEVAALCPDCVNRVQTQHLSKDIKILKRKARRKRISEVKISIR